jgi:thiol-disulfide isomerase/thioredoxin
LFLLGLFIFVGNSNASAQEMMEKEASADKPIVAVIKADWCPYCKRVDPVISSLMGDYAEKFNFVAFDVTDEATTAESLKKAKALGLEDFFNKYKGKTSTVAVLVDKEIVYKTSNNSKRGDYVKAFDEALK